MLNTAPPSSDNAKNNADLPIAWSGQGTQSRDDLKAKAQGIADALEAQGRARSVAVILAQNRFAFMAALYGAMLAECDVYLPHDNTAFALSSLARILRRWLSNVRSEM